MTSWAVYIVRCADGTLYTGIATNVEARIAAHNRGSGAKYTRSRRPVELVYQEPAIDRGAAQRREHAIRRLAPEAKRSLVHEAERSLVHEAERSLVHDAKRSVVLEAEPGTARAQRRAASR